MVFSFQLKPRETVEDAQPACVTKLLFFADFETYVERKAINLVAHTCHKFERLINLTPVKTKPLCSGDTRQIPNPVSYACRLCERQSIDFRDQSTTPREVKDGREK